MIKFLIYALMFAIVLLVILVIYDNINIDWQAKNEKRKNKTIDRIPLDKDLK